MIDEAFEIVVVNSGGKLDELMALFRQIASPLLRIVDLPDEPFNKAQALNIGGLCGRGERIFMVDADILLSVQTLDEIRKTWAVGNFVTIRKVVESAPSPRLRGVDIVQTTEYVCSDGRSASFEYRLGKDNSRCGPGLVFVSRTDFISVGGFNSQLQDCGFEDYDFQLRLQFALKLERVTISEVAHLSHNSYSSKSNLVRRNDTERVNRFIAENAYAQCDYFGTYSHDVEKWRHRFREFSYAPVAPKNV